MNSFDFNFSGPSLNQNELATVLQVQDLDVKTAIGQAELLQRKTETFHPKADLSNYPDFGEQRQNHHAPSPSDWNSKTSEIAFHSCSGANHQLHDVDHFLGHCLECVG
jgi:hypothetical protein